METNCATIGNSGGRSPADDPHGDDGIVGRTRNAEAGRAAAGGGSVSKPSGQRQGPAMPPHGHLLNGADGEGKRGADTGGAELPSSAHNTTAPGPSSPQDCSA